MVVCVPVKGFFEENTYFYIDDKTKHGFLIDPGAEADKLLRVIRRESWIIEAVLLTHGHFDHFEALDEVRAALGVPVYAHEDSDRYLLDGRMNLSSFCIGEMLVRGAEPLRDGDVLCLSAIPDFALKAIHTPGHTTDSVMYYSKNDRIAFVGDTIFKGTIGNWQYPGGDRGTLIRSIINKVFALPDETKLYSGHSEVTTVGDERSRYAIR